SGKREVVPLLDGSPSTAIVRDQKNAVYLGTGDHAGADHHDAGEPLSCEVDPSHEKCLRQTLAQRYAGTALEVPFRNMASSADFVLRRRQGPPLGLVSFYSDRKWYFTRHRQRSLEDIVWRL